MRIRLAVVLFCIGLLIAPESAWAGAQVESQMTLEQTLVTAAVGTELTVGVLSTVVNGVHLVRGKRRGLFWPVAGMVSGGLLLGTLTVTALQKGDFGYPYPPGMLWGGAMAGAGIGAFLLPARGPLALRLSPALHLEAGEPMPGLALTGVWLPESSR